MATPTAMWLLDEASSGTTPTTANDTAAGTPVNLTAVFASGSWTSDAQGNGIVFAGGTTGAVSGAITATKLGTGGGLTNSKLCTLEMRYKHPASSALGTDGIFGITSTSFGPETAIGFQAASATLLYLMFNDTLIGNVTVAASTTYTIHLVFDTAQAVAADRFKCYLNGSLATINSYSAPAQNSQIPIDSTSCVSMGCNTSTGYEPSTATLFFAAVYCGQALTAGECLSNATNLIATNDANPNFQNPIITAQPQTQYVQEGSAGTFNVSATGTGTLHYQWKLNGSDVGTDSSSYTTATTTFADNYSVIVVEITDDIGTTTSVSVFLSVYQVPQLAWYFA